MPPPNAYSLPFYKLYPGGNPTVLLPEGQHLPAASGPEQRIQRAAIANALMKTGHLAAEQVGFVDFAGSPPHLEMMGGEFCVNACRSAALVFALSGLLPIKRQAPDGTPLAWAGNISASGSERPLAVKVAAQFDADPTPGTPPDLKNYTAAVAVPLPETAAGATPFPLETIAPGATLVRVPGIAHLLLDMAEHPLPQEWQAAAVSWRQRCGLDNEEAVGVVWHNREGSGETRCIHPAVWVRDTDSLVMETACGSGSLALALMALRDEGTTALSVLQSSGETLQVHVTKDAAWIDGLVRVMAQGMAYITNDILHQ